MVGLFRRMFHRSPATPRESSPPTPMGTISLLSGPAQELADFLRARGLAETAFRGGDAPYLVSDAVYSEHLVQAWCTDDPLLREVQVNGEDLKGDRPAWFALTTHRLAVGRVSHAWTEQLAVLSLRYRDAPTMLWERRGDDTWRVTFRGPQGRIDLVMSSSLPEEALTRIRDFIGAAAQEAKAA
ncbi:MAG: hypothetical protein ACK4K2_03740 [Dehalococcoidia bacterium]